MKFAITIPVLNEESTLERNITILRDFLDHEFSGRPTVGIVISDNGSTDATKGLGEKLALTLEDVKYIRLETRGVGKALKASWNDSDADIVGYMDLDLATDLSHLKQVLNAFDEANVDFINGSRLAQGSEVRGRSLRRNISSHSMNWLIRRIFKTTFTDGMCGFKFLKRSILPDLENVGAKSDGWFFATELLVSAERLGYNVSEIPVKWTDDPNSKVKILKLSIEYLRAMFRLRRALNDAGV